MLNSEIILNLSYEAAAAGDIIMAAICHKALNRGSDAYADYALTDKERKYVDAMTQGEALRLVCDALLDANSASAA